jgi:uncharacterized protein YkwD
VKIHGLPSCFCLSIHQQVRAMRGSQTFLRQKAMLAILAAAVLAGCNSSPAPQQAARPVVAAQAVPFSAQNAMGLINAYRAENGLGPVRVDPILMQAAQSHSRAMEAAGQMSHDVGGSFNSRIMAANIGARYAVENISSGRRNLGDVIQSWKSSPAHAANMLTSSVTRMGIAASGSYWTLIMASD